MGRLTRTLGTVVMLAAVTLPAAADQAKSFYNQGRDAEARQNYEAAYDDYKKAYDLRPKDLRYRTAFERLRFLAAATKVHRGQLLRQDGHLQEALTLFLSAAAIDPSSFIAQQEIKRTKQMIQEAQSQAAPQSRSAPPSGLEKRLQAAGGPVELAPLSNVPITLKLTEDSKVIYETIGKLAGINVLFDPDYTSRRVKIELNGVTLQQALEIVALESKTFWRPVTSNTIFVAADNPAKRKELEQSVIKTFYLSNLSQPTELQDVVNAMRTILEVQRIQQLPSQNAIVVRGTPDQVALAEKLVDDIDKPKAEVVVEVAVMQVSREKMRTLGISPPTSATITLQDNVNTNTTNNNTNNSNNNNTNNTNGTSSPGSINLNRLGNLNATDFQVNIGQATATALFTDNDSRLIQNPQIRALDGQKASLKIGQRVPVATGSFQPGIGGVGINPLVNTQFQYLDVGVNVDITPHVHGDDSITLKVMLDISAVDTTTNIGGINQPVIGQRKIEHEIRLKAGEVNILGGIMDQRDTRALTGYPWLSQVPILKYFFSQNTRDRLDDETVFVLVPHIVRSQDVDVMNARVVDVGTANAISLRPTAQLQSSPSSSAQVQPANQGAPATPGVAPSAPAGQPAPAQQPPSGLPPAQPPQEQSSPQARVDQSAAPAAGTTLTFDPLTLRQAAGSTFTVNVVLRGAQNVYSVPVQISYNPNVLQVLNVSNGSLLSKDGQAVALVHREDTTAGMLQITATRPPNSGGVSGQGDVFTLTFMARAPGTSTLTIVRDGIRDAAMQMIQASAGQATVVVR